MSPGPPPKPAHARRRYSQPAGGEWVILEPLDKPVLPSLPLRPRSRGAWSDRAKAAWAAWRQDPVTARWSPADTAFAIDTLYLVDALTRNMQAALAGEIRQRLDSLGLTPKGKQNLRWRYAEPAEVVQHPTTLSSSTAARQRRLLRAVDVQGDG